MSLQKKIIMSFLISSIIVVILAVSAYFNFIEVRKEIRYLELSDTIRSKSLQIRRHEKNFFLYGDIKEIENVHIYIRDINEILKQASKVYKTEKLASLETKIKEYSQRFNHIEILFWEIRKEFNRLKPLYKQYSVFFPLIESNTLEHPLVNAELLKNVFLLKPEDITIKHLQEINEEISTLRKNGEEIVAVSKEIDKTAREKVENVISLSQKAALILFPLFLVVGIGTLFIISHSVVKRLKILTSAIEKTGKGDFSSFLLSDKEDEVNIFVNALFKMKQDLITEEDEIGKLINAFVKMENDLTQRDEEISRKGEELLQSRKLASIGTLASGIAHELNNPLNNIYLAAQILSKEINEETCPPKVKETVKDIFSQTLRVKRIVTDLLEFSREKPPQLNRINVVNVVKDILQQMTVSGEISDVKYAVEAPDSIEALADRYLTEQVFINLFSNAVDAMNGRGQLNIEIKTIDNAVQFRVSDTGKGISPKDIRRIFDPFFTTKDKGTGLGLAIVYSIIEKHNGKIEVESTEGKGTVFTIKLPRVPC